MPKKLKFIPPVPTEIITQKIYYIRGMRVMLDRDLATLYQVETRALKQAVRRNSERFPLDFMFELTKEEFKNWRSQFVTSNEDKMGLRHPPMAFTEQGVAMLSSVLRSKRAILVNIQIMRAFTQLRSMLTGYDELKRKIEAMERKYDDNFQVVFEAIKQLLEVEKSPKRRIGFVNAKIEKRRSKGRKARR
ncbi:MAG: ORF6N domain-containing protein [Desulfobacterales bacterium]